MAVYGYRIHTLSPNLARGRTADAELRIEDVSKAGGQTDGFDEFVVQLEELRDALTQIGTPTFYVDEQHEEARQEKFAEAENLPYFQVTSFNQSGRTLEVFIETGREADHDALVDRFGQHSAIKKKAAVRKSVVLLTFPAKGDMAIMVSEVRGRGYAGEQLIQWMTRRAQRNAVNVVGDSRKEDPWLNWNMTSHMDSDRLDGILNGSANHGFRLRRRVITKTGGRASYDVELVQWGLKKTPIEKVAKVLADMATRRSKGTELDRRKDAAADVLTLIEPGVGGIDFDDAELTFNENGKTQTINSETVDQLYIYPIGSKRPKTHQLRSEAKPVVDRIAMTLGIEAQL